MNKYKRWYDELMWSRQFRGKQAGHTYERHHIIPRAFGGTNDDDNLVYLTPREHFLAHWLLTKFTVGKDLFKMLKALHKMTQGRKLAGWQYEVARQANVASMIGNKYGAGPKRPRGPFTNEHKRKISEALKGKKRPGMKRKEQTGEQNHMFGKIGSAHHNYGKRWKITDPEKRARMSEARKLMWKKRKEENHYG